MPKAPPYSSQSGSNFTIKGSIFPSSASFHKLDEDLIALVPIIPQKDDQTNVTLAVGSYIGSGRTAYPFYRIPEIISSKKWRSSSVILKKENPIPER